MNKRKQIEHTYTVRGPGTFPEDMLRYDEARFASQEDEQASKQRGIKTVKIIGKRSPTVGRWNSFLWDVI